MVLKVNYSGVLNHVEFLKEERRLLQKIEEELKAFYFADGINTTCLSEAIDGIDRLTKSVERKRNYLEDLVSEFRAVQLEAHDTLDELEFYFNNYLEIEE